MDQSSNTANRGYILLLGDDADFGRFVAGFQFHTPPILLRFLSKRTAGKVTSSASFVECSSIG
jgi:hypothetical protein